MERNNKSPKGSSLRSSVVIQEEKVNGTTSSTHSKHKKGGSSAQQSTNQKSSRHSVNDDVNKEENHLDDHHQSLELDASHIVEVPPLNQLLPDINKRPSHHALPREDSFETLKSPCQIPQIASINSSSTSSSSPLHSPHQRTEFSSRRKKISHQVGSSNGDEGHVKRHVLKSTNSVRLLDTFQKMSSTRTLIKQDPAFESKLIEYEEKRPKQEMEECKKMVFSQLDDMRKVSPTSIYDNSFSNAQPVKTYASKNRGSDRVRNDDEYSDEEEQDLAYSKREIGKLYAKEIGRESLHLICKVRRNMKKQDSFIQELNDTNIKEKFERNMSLLKGYGTNKQHGLKVME